MSQLVRVDVVQTTKFDIRLFHVKHSLSNRISAAHFLFHVKHLASSVRLC